MDVTLVGQNLNKVTILTFMQQPIALSCANSL